MPQRTHDGHQWVGAATIDLPPTQVRSAHKRGTFTIRASDVKVGIEAVWCKNCRRDFSRVEGQPCEALVSREHLIGGPLGDQRKRQGEDQPGDPLAATG